MEERYLGTSGYSDEAKKLIKRIVKAYYKLGLITKLKKCKYGYRFISTESELKCLLEEMRFRFIEAGLN